MFPRLFAFAEGLWTPRRSRDIRELQTRIGPQLRRFDLLGVPYYGKPQTSGTTSSELPQSPAM
jgi:N-acetyl-beta-hexosaminidase